MRRILLLFALCAPAFGQSWYNVSWAHRKAVTIDHTKVPSAQTNFPVLVSVTDAAIAASAQSSGADILFTASDGVTKLNHERVFYASGTGKLEAWVNVPSLSSTVDTVVYVYYGNATATDQQNVAGTWDANYKTVLHMADGTTLSTANSAGTATFSLNGTPTATTGKIDGGGAFNGTNQAFDASAAAVTAAPLTFEAWANPSAATANGVTNGLIFAVINSGAWSGWYIHWAGTQFKATATSNSSWAESVSASQSTNTWHHVVGVFASDSSRTIYVDGVAATPETTTKVPTFTPNGMHVGGFIGTGNWFPGSLDEVRLSNIARSADWITTEYNNQNSPSTFMSFGAEQNAPPTASITITSSPSGLTLTVDGVSITSPQTYTWAQGDTHTIAAATQGTTTLNTFASWSDAGAASHSITVPTTTTTYTANFTTQYQLTTSASPSAGGTVTPATGYHSPGAVVSVDQTPNAGYTFSAYSGALTGSASPQNVTMSGPLSVVANYTAITEHTTITSSPSGLSLTVDGTPCTAPCVFDWVEFSTHTVAAADQPGTTGTRYVFGSWSDSGSATHTVTATAPATYTASFTTQYQITTTAGSNGTISPTTGTWYNAGTVVSVSATPNAGYAIAAFSGTLSGTTSPQNVTMSGPVTVGVTFTFVGIALSNSVTIYEATGALQTARPLSIARWFAQGEIAHYPAPYVKAGAAITPWQADVKTRWSDGSVQFAIVSFTQTLSANGNVAVEFRDSTAASSSPGSTGLTPAQMLTFNSSGWGAKIETTSNSIVQSADARAMLAGLAAAPDQLRCWLCGPVVTQMIVEDRTSARSYDWGYQGTPQTVRPTADFTTSTFTAASHGFSNGQRIWFSVDQALGVSSTPLPTGLTKGKLYFVINATTNTFQVSLTSGGAAVTLSDNGSTAFYALRPYSDYPWSAASDSAHKSLHPIFVVTAYAGWPGVRTEYILENTWIDRVQDQWFSAMKLYSGSAETTVAANMAPFVQSSRTRWRKLCWDGTAPAGEPVCGTDTTVITPRPKGILVDYNLPYMVYSGATMPFDTTKDADSIAFRVADWWGCWTTGVSGSNNNCPSSNTTKGDVAASATPGTVSAAGFLNSMQYLEGGNPLIGLIPTTEAEHLYEMGNTNQTMTTRLHAAELAMDIGFAQSYWGTHYREGDATKKYLTTFEEPAQTTTAFGRPVSMSARPTFESLLNPAGLTASADLMTVVGSIRQFASAGTGHSGEASNSTLVTQCDCGEVLEFSEDKAHSWMPVFNAYRLLGDWYTLEETQYWASWYLSANNPVINSTVTYAESFGAHESWALPQMNHNARIAAWQTRAVGMAYAATPTEDAYYVPERTYYASKLKYGFYYFEGIMDVRDGVFAKDYPSYTAWGCSTWDNVAVTLPGHTYDDPYNAWAWGRCNQAFDKPNPMHFPWAYFPATGANCNGAGCPPYLNPAMVGAENNTYMFVYQDHAFEMLSRLGSADAETFLQRGFRRLFIDSVKDFNYHFSQYLMPTSDINGLPFTSWTAMVAAHTANDSGRDYRKLSQWCNPLPTALGTWDCGDFPYIVLHSYQQMYVNALKLSTPATGFSGVSGRSANRWAVANQMYKYYFGSPGLNDYHVDPRFAWQWQGITNVQVAAGSTQAVIRWSSFSGDVCRIGIATGFTSSDGASDTLVSLSGYAGVYVATGLTASTAYQYRITCGPNGGTARTVGTFTTVAAGTTTNIPFTLRPPTSLGVSTALIEYGATSGLGSSTSAVACSTGCTINVSGTTGQVLFYRVRYRNAGGSTISPGNGVQAIVP